MHSSNRVSIITNLDLLKMNLKKVVVAQQSVPLSLSFFFLPNLVQFSHRCAKKKPGVDFKVKMLEWKGKKLNLRIWDTGASA